MYGPHAPTLRCDWPDRSLPSCGIDPCRPGTKRPKPAETGVQGGSEISTRIEAERDWWHRPAGGCDQSQRLGSEDLAGWWKPGSRGCSYCGGQAMEVCRFRPPDDHRSPAGFYPSLENCAGKGLFRSRSESFEISIAMNGKEPGSRGADCHSRSSHAVLG